MREVDRSSDASASRSSEPPQSSRFIGTNIDAAQAYVAPMAPLETLEPPAPDSKVALSADVDPRKAPTNPKLKQTAKALSAELEPVIEAPPDSQPSGMRRGAGYAPSRSNFPPPIAAAAAAARTEAAQRNTPVRPFPKATLRATPPDAAETPAQRRAAILLIFLFAALLAIAVYFFALRPQTTNAGPPSPSATASATAPASTPSPVAPRPSSSASAEPSPSSSVSAAPTADALPAPVFTGPRTSTTSAHEAPSTQVAEPPPSAAPTASASVAPTASDKPKSGRWF